MLSNLRKAVAGQDDATLTRWVKEPGRHTSTRKTAPMPADATGTRFRKAIIRPEDAGQLLVSGHNNVKIGRDVRKGALRGYWIYTLSLEERATCPSSCRHWTNCYGNSMPFAKRVVHGPALEAKLEVEIARLLAVRGRKGILIRLHALGDFYSRDYVDFWLRMLDTHPRLAVFGYTARTLEDPIGAEVENVMQIHPSRFAIRFSDGGRATNCTVSIDTAADRPADAFLCPEQNGGTKCCATCAACWSTDRNVAFVAH